tara:strand:+ start:399 stop:710 length:312 start_codon:yes stop_codon:yes gene_type:complete
MGRQYEQSEWFEFLTGCDDHPEYVKALQAEFEERIADLLCLDQWIDIDPDPVEIAYLAFSSIMGHGIGLWEEREPYHADLEVAILADSQIVGIAHRLEAESLQ